MRRHLVLLIIPAIFLLDRLTKVLVIVHMDYLETITMVPFFSIVHARNTGGAFSLLSQHHMAKYIFTFFPVAIACVLLYIMLARRLEPVKYFSLASILSGATGNIYDRFSYGYVVDFLDFYWGPYHWPAFNVADISITVGVGLWFLAEFKAVKNKNRG